MTKFIKAVFDADRRNMTAWTENNCVEFWTFTQEQYDDCVTFDNLLNFICGAAELPEGFSSYEDWAEYLWRYENPEEILIDTSYCCQWSDICRLAGVDPEEIPYGSCHTIRPANWKVA